MSEWEKNAKRKASEMTKLEEISSRIVASMLNGLITFEDYPEEWLDETIKNATLCAEKLLEVLEERK